MIAETELAWYGLNRKMQKRHSIARKALFLDRDGVINADTGYPHLPEHIRFLPGIFDLCRAAREKGYLLLVITNQAGIGRGYYTEADFEALMQWMAERFAAESCPLDGWYFCPHHPEHGQGKYKTACDCRKPSPGMLLRAAREHGIDMASSLLIGDKESDVEAGKAAGLGRCLLLADGNPLSFLDAL